MPIFKSRRRAVDIIYSPQIDQEFVQMMEITSNIVDRLTSGGELNEDQTESLFNDAFSAGVRWTALSEGGYFTSVATPSAEAFSKIVLGLKDGEPSHVQSGVQQIVDVARVVQSRNRR